MDRARYLVEKKIPGITIIGAVRAQHQMTPQPELSRHQRSRSTVIALHSATGDQDLNAIIDRMRCDELEFSDLVSRESGTR